MKKMQKTMHTAAAILIDVLLVVLVLLAFLWMHESTKSTGETKLPSRSASMRPLGNSFAAAATKLPAANVPATTLQVRYEGGRLVPIIAR